MSALPQQAVNSMCKRSLDGDLCEKNIFYFHIFSGFQT